MFKVIGGLLVLGGVSGFLQSWIGTQKKQQMRLELFLLFLQKSLYVMQTEKVKVIDYFKRYIDQETVLLENHDTTLNQVLEELVRRLSSNNYPNGQMVWEEVFGESESFQFDSEVFRTIVQAGNGFFGRSREENIGFLKREIKELEKQQEKIKEKHIQERKVWIPVGMLGSLMLVILFL